MIGPRKMRLKSMLLRARKPTTFLLKICPVRVPVCRWTEAACSPWAFLVAEVLEAGAPFENLREREPQGALLVDVGREHGHAAQVAVLLREVEAVAHDELVGDLEADV